MPNRIDHSSGLPIHGKQPRKTEDTDTRQAIQRHDPEFYRKKKDNDEQPGFKDPYEDLADVSVPALRSFLSGLLDKIPGDGPEATAASTPHAEQRAPSSPKAAAAMQAYQTGAHRGSATPPPPPPPPPSAGDAPTALDQAAAGLNRAEVLELIRELDRLSAEGVTAIGMEKGEGFLGSIREAITRARS